MLAPARELVFDVFEIGFDGAGREMKEGGGLFGRFALSEMFEALFFSWGEVFEGETEAFEVGKFCLLIEVWMDLFVSKKIGPLNIG